jgi:hypothetical protein
MRFNVRDLMINLAARFPAFVGGCDLAGSCANASCA